MVLLGIVSYKVFPARLGGQKGIADFYRFMSKDNEVIVAASSDNTVDASYPFKLFPFLFNQWKGFFNIFYIPRLLQLIRKYKVDLIIIEHSYFGWLGIMLRWLTGKPFIIHSHNIESHRFNVAGRKWWRLYVRYEIYVHKKADFTLFKCEEDRDWAVTQWKISAAKCMIVTYGTVIEHAPSMAEKAHCREQIAKLHEIENNETIFLFNGSLNYVPNIDSINIIIQQLIPELQKTAFKYRIIICGDYLSNALAQQIANIPQIIFTGYVPDINVYFKTADAFLNPSVLATGIKTKLVEALANDLTVISTVSGARGINCALAPEKILLVENENWKEFVTEMIQVKNRQHANTAATFYEAFFWGNIVARVNNCLADLIGK
jgi:hypothetical protein